MVFDIDFNTDKDLLLKESRGIGFEEIMRSILSKNLIDDIEHFNKAKYPNQRIYVVRHKGCIYIVPYVIDKARKVIFLKTIYVNKKIVKIYK